MAQVGIFVVIWNVTAKQSPSSRLEMDPKSKFTVDLSPNITRYGIDFWNRISLKFRINAVLTAGMVYKRPRKRKGDEGKTPPPMINDPSEEKKIASLCPSRRWCKSTFL